MRKRKPPVQRLLPESPDFDLPVPEGFDTPEFREEWLAFCEHRVAMERRDKRRPWTLLAAQATLRKLARYDVEIAVMALQSAIAGSYQGVFPESIKVAGPSRGGQSRPSIHPSAFEDDR